MKIFRRAAAALALFLTVLTQPLLSQPTCNLKGELVDGSSADYDDDAFPDFRDVDDDNDGLIEICRLEGLDAIHYSADSTSSGGIGYKTSYDNVAANTFGCKSGGCNGYELVKDLDFNNPSDYLPPPASTTRTNLTIWTTAKGWPPIDRPPPPNQDVQRDISPIAAIFEGNGHTISNLFIDQHDGRLPARMKSGGLAY